MIFRNLFLESLTGRLGSLNVLRHKAHRNRPSLSDQIFELEHLGQRAVIPALSNIAGTEFQTLPITYSP